MTIRDNPFSQGPLSVHSSTLTTALPRSDALRRKRKWRCLPRFPSPTAAWMKPEIMDSNGKGDFHRPTFQNESVFFVAFKVLGFYSLHFIKNIPAGPISKRYIYSHFLV